MIWRLAWRSLWRNRRRTLISVVAIAFALGLTVFFLAFADGVYHQMINDAVRMQAGHLTVQHEEYRDAPAIDLLVSSGPELRSSLEGIVGVLGTKGLILGQVVVKSGSGAVGAAALGVEADREVQTSPLAMRIVEGEYLADSDARKVVIGTKMASRLKLKVGKKLVLSTNDVDGQLTEALFRVKGIFELGASEVDGYLVQLPVAAARALFGLDSDHLTQLGVLLEDGADRDAIQGDIRKKLADPTAVVLPWEEVMPELAAYVSIDRGSNIIFQGVLIFLSLFTIFNTILMSVLERTREFAVLLALGTPVSWLRKQLLCESVLLALLGVAAGLAFGVAVTYPMQVYGLDLTQFTDGEMSVSGFAVDTRVRARMTAGLLVAVAGLIFSATIVLSLLPMMRLSKIRVTDVLR